MDRLILIALATIGALCFAVPVNADSNETANTVAQCRVNLDGCRNSIGLAVVLGGDWCAPKDMVLPTDVEVQGILSWLEDAPASRTRRLGRSDGRCARSPLSLFEMTARF